MKLKHWAGYGTLEVKRIGKVAPYQTAEIDKYIHRFEITGGHERGHLPYYEDNYTIQNWLKRFLKGERVVQYWADNFNCGGIEDTFLYVITRR